MRRTEGAPASWQGEERDDTTAQWRRMVDGVRRGDESAAADFHHTYGRGVAILLRRRLGPVAGERLANEILAGAIEEIRNGTISEPREMVRFIRGVMDRQPVERSAEPLLGANDRARIRVKAARIKAVLPQFHQRERELLRRYYADGVDPAALGVSTEEWLSLRARFDAAIEREESPQRVRHSHPAGLAKRATA